MKEELTKELILNWIEKKHKDSCNWDDEIS